MARRSTFEADAESVQGNAGATITFKAITVAEYADYRASEETEQELLAAHVVAWKGIEDDDGHALPNPKGKPDIIGQLYISEKNAVFRLLLAGAPPIPVKN